MESTEAYRSYRKSPYKSIKHSTYFDAYDHFFSSYRNREITFVEIGVLGGGSLFMWRHFFGPKARIIGVDLNPDAKKWEEHGFEIFIGSQSDNKFWERFINDVGSVDAVLDDGGHTYEQQIITVECLLPAIRHNGILVVEDTHTSYMKGFGPKRYSFMEYTKDLIDKINMRFSKFASQPSESRCWSIEVVESMVAFRINKDASSLESMPTNNGGIDDSAQDFRFGANSGDRRRHKANKFISVLKSLPFSISVAKALKSYWDNRRFTAHRYFK